MDIIKLTAEEYKAKLISYHKDKGNPKIEINHCGKNIVLKRVYCEEYFIENLDLL